jgi:hypothetical protein
MKEYQEKLDGGRKSAVDPDGKNVDYALELKRLQYKIRILEGRRDRLLALDHWTFRELPMQCITAARAGDAEFVKMCHHAGVELNTQDETGSTALIAAAIENKLSVVRVLVEAQADPRMQDENGATCCHYAVQLDHIHVVSALLDSEAFDAFTIKDSRGRSAVDDARRADREPHLRLIRSRMGGPGKLLHNICQGWCWDLMGVPRTTMSFYKLFECDTVHCAAKAEPILACCGLNTHEKEAEEGPGKKKKLASNFGRERAKAKGKLKQKSMGASFDPEEWESASDDE